MKEASEVREPIKVSDQSPCSIGGGVQARNWRWLASRTSSRQPVLPPGQESIADEGEHTAAQSFHQARHLPVSALVIPGQCINRLRHRLMLPPHPELLQDRCTASTSPSVGTGTGRGRRRSDILKYLH